MKITVSCPSLQISRLAIANLPANTTILEVIVGEGFPDALKKGLHKKKIIAATIQQQLSDMNQALSTGDQVELLTFEDDLGKYVFWHSSAHILGEAVMRLYPEARPTIGPPIEEGFYYDFADLAIVESDLERINNVAQEILQQKQQFQKTVFANAEQALLSFSNNLYKCSMIRDIEKKKETLTAYRQGSFLDLCRGPHLIDTALIQGFQVTKMSGSYWRGDASQDQLTRIYGISFPSKKELKSYFFRIEEAKKRDHRIMAKTLNLFSFHEHSPGMPFFHPAGLSIFNQLIQFSRELQTAHGYQEIKTPHMLRRELWETSGHWENYQQNMYIANVLEEGYYAIKPMNCPGCMLHFRNHQYSYRQLPLRFSEFGLVHRHEASGALAGLFRVRSFHQDDAHIFLTQKQISAEIARILQLAETLYATFGLSTHLELSTRPKESIGSDADWLATTSALEQALKDCKKEYRINEGDGAFYGPKIDFHIRDCLGRTWQCGTIQLDMSLPLRFDLTYIDEKGQKAKPIVIHRALLGSVERFMAIVLEHFYGKLPLWLSPIQVILLPVHESHRQASKDILTKINSMMPMPLRAEIDESEETLGKKIRLAQNRKINYMLVIGDKEASNNGDELAIRLRDQKQPYHVSKKKFAENLQQEIAKRSQQSLWVPPNSSPTAPSAPNAKE